MPVNKDDRIKKSASRGTLDKAAANIKNAQANADRANGAGAMEVTASQVTETLSRSASSTSISVPMEGVDSSGPARALSRSASSTNVSSDAASSEAAQAPSGTLRRSQSTNNLANPGMQAEPAAGFKTEKTVSNEMLDSAASAHVDGLLVNKRLPLGGNVLAKDARTEMLKIAEQKFDTMRNGTWAEKKAIAAEMNEHGQKVVYANGKTHAKMDVIGVQQLGKVTETFAKARAESLVPQGITSAPETTVIPPQTQRNVAELMSGPRGIEALVMARAVDKTAAAGQVYNGEVKAHSQSDIRHSNLTASIANTQAAIQKELAPYTAEGPDGAKRMAAAIGEISKNRDAIVADRGLHKTELYAAVNAKADPSLAPLSTVGPKTREEKYATKDIPAFKAPGVAEARTGNSVSTPASNRQAIEIQAVPERGAASVDATANATRRVVQSKEAAAAAKPGTSREAPAALPPERSRDRSAGGRAG